MRHDVVVWGATGFTGELVAAYLLARRGAEGWALAGRSREKLEAVRRRLAERDDAAMAVPILTADATDPDSLRRLAAQAKVICTTVGPYARHGSALVAAAVAEGTHTVDLTGEVQWMHRMIHEHHEAARARGVRIVHACGFDSVPSDLGNHVLQQEAVRRFGRWLPDVRLYVKRLRGGVSGGTIASMKLLLEEAAADRDVRRVVANPYSLLPEGAPRGPRVSDTRGVAWDAEEATWTGPFVMASTNAPVVRRSHALLGSPLGDGFRYTEASDTGAGPRGWARAAGMTGGLGALVAALSTPLGRRVADRFLPQPGDGPSAVAQASGSFRVDVVGRGVDDAGQAVTLRCTVRGDKDPGYGATSGMIAEAALCLAQDALPDVAGVLTPSVAMGDALVRRLPNAGVTFSVA